MTLAEAVAAVARPLHRAPIVSTRHFARSRGATRLGGALAPWIARRMARELAVSEFVARSVEQPPDAVVRSGVGAGPMVWRTESRTVLVLQRLEPEKDTQTALRAWHEARLVASGWSMRIAGAGSERELLERWARDNGVEGVAFAGWSDAPARELAAAGIVLAPCALDSFGLTVAEAMVAGVPVVAAAGGGHLETIGRVPGVTLFEPGDAGAAATELRSLLDDRTRGARSLAGRKFALEQLTLAGHVDRLLAQYELASGRS
jgi:glycosyltransferase involved in cell wall biosynthesis